MSPSSIVYTVGHGSRDFGEVASQLLELGLGMIVDVRAVPYSRHAPDFTKAQLPGLAADFNLGYRWLGDRLGGIPSRPGEAADMTDSPSFRAGLAELEGLAAAAHLVLLCAELDPTHCHRSTVLAPELELRGHTVIHILGDGSKVWHQPRLGLDET